MTEENTRESERETGNGRTSSPQEDQENRARIEQQLNALLASILDPQAKARLSNVRLVNYEKYLQVSQALIMLHKQGRISGKVSEEQVKQLLVQLTPKKKDFTIRRK